MLIATPIFCLILMLVGANPQPEPAPAPHPAPAPSPMPAPNPPPGPQPQPQKPRPGSQVKWTEFKAEKNLSNDAWGVYLTDIENHLPWKYGKQYRFDDKNTWAHETTHGIQAHLNNEWSKADRNGKRDVYWLYIGYDKAAGIPQPNIKISDISRLVPEKLRKSRFNLYLVEQRKYFENEPIYIFDEWVAYCNGAECGNELLNKKLVQKQNKTDELWSVVEFSVYATYVAISQKKNDPDYDNKQLMEFLAFNLERSMKLYRDGMKHDCLNWDNNEYLEFLKTAPEASEWRGFLIDNYGATWTKEVYGFDKK